MEWELKQQQSRRDQRAEGETSREEADGGDGCKDVGQEAATDAQGMS